jgi:hypothetical protein
MNPRLGWFTIAAALGAVSSLARTASGADAPPAASGTAPTSSTPEPAASAPAPSDAAATEPAGASANVEASIGTDKSTADASTTAEAEAAGVPVIIETAPGALRCQGKDAGHQGDHPGYADKSCWDGQLGAKGIELHGGLELDAGYAEYGFRDLPTTPEREFLDLRGRFVLGAHLHHEFGKSGYWVHAAGELVAWAREIEDHYQINVDDVYAQVGHTGGPFTNWDFQIGRFMTWRVYHKGLGFDLYTLEDCGAERQPGVCGVHTYEVNYIYLRNSPPPIDHESAGRAAIHYYPHRMLGIELAGVLGQVGSGNDNSIGGRLALDFHKGFGPEWRGTQLVMVRASAGAEYRASRPALRTATQDPNTLEYTSCIDCNFADNKGVGGGVIAKVGPVEISGSGARGYDMKHLSVSGANDPTRSARSPQDTAEITSFGGYAELDAGKLAFGRSLILGAGAHRTERLQETKDYQVHLQGAAYVAFPLGFNDAMVKFVMSRAELDNYQRTSVVGAPLQFRLTQSAMTAGRLRFKYSF